MFKKTFSRAPFLHTKKNAITMTWLKILATLPIVIAAIYFYRFAAIERMAIVLIGCFIAEFFARYFSAQKANLLAGNSLWEGLVLSMLLPTTLPLWICFTAGFFMILFFREFYGGVYQNICSPALACLLFLTASFPLLIADFAVPVHSSEVVHPYLLWKTNGESLSWIELFLGMHPSAIGNGCIFACLLGGAFLIVKRIVIWELPFIYLVLYAGFNFVAGFPLPLSLFGGYAVFIAFFILPFGPYVPYDLKAKRLYVITAALLSVLVQRYSFYADGALFGVFIASLMTPWFNRIYQRDIKEEAECV